MVAPAPPAGQHFAIALVLSNDIACTGQLGGSTCGPAALPPALSLHLCSEMTLLLQGGREEAPSARQQACTLTLYSDSEDDDEDFKP